MKRGRKIHSLLTEVGPNLLLPRPKPGFRSQEFRSTGQERGGHLCTAQKPRDRTSQMRFCCSRVSLGSFFLSISMDRPTMYSRQMVMSCCACRGGKARSRCRGKAVGEPRTRISGCASYLRDLLFVVHHEKRHAEQNGAELLHSLLKLAHCGELVAELQPLDEVIQLQAHGRHAVLQPCILPASTEKQEEDRITGTQRGKQEGEPHTGV